MIKIGTNFEYLGEQFLDGRQGIESLSSLESWGSPVPLGFEVFVSEKDAWYIYVGTDSTTGKKIWVPRISTELVREEYRNYVGVTQEYVGDNLAEMKKDIEDLLDEKFKFEASFSPGSITGASTSYYWDFSEQNEDKYTHTFNYRITVTGTKRGQDVSDNMTVTVGGSSDNVTKEGNSFIYTGSKTLSFTNKTTTTSVSDGFTITATYRKDPANPNKKEIKEKAYSFSFTRTRKPYYYGYTENDIPTTSITDLSLYRPVDPTKGTDETTHTYNATDDNNAPKVARMVVVVGSASGIGSKNFWVRGLMDTGWTKFSGTDNRYGPWTIYIHNEKNTLSNLPIEIK